MTGRANEPARRDVAITADGPTTVSALLERLGLAAAGALEEGRVFVGRRRVQRSDEPVAERERLTVFPPRDAAGRVVLLAEEAGVVAVVKPAALASVPDHHGDTGSLLLALVEQAGEQARTWQPASRLDVGVSGVLLVATTPAALEWLKRARQAGRYRRHYVAIAGGSPRPEKGTFEEPIGRGKNPRLRAVRGLEAQEASTRYALAATAPRGHALLAVEPQTGRTHQIRVHCAHAGSPLVGDGVYGGATRLVDAQGRVTSPGRIALHSAWVEVPLPGGARTWRVEAPIPNELSELWQSLGGEPGAWPRALERCYMAGDGVA